MVAQTGTHAALAVDQGSCNSANTRLSDGSIVPEIAAVPVWRAVTNVLLCDVGTEVEDGPAS